MAIGNEEETRSNNYRNWEIIRGKQKFIEVNA